MNRNYPHFAIPEIYGESLSYYELLRKVVKAMNIMIENYDTIPDQIDEAVKNLDASQLFSAVLNQIINSIATDNTKSANAVKVYEKHDLLYATFNETVNLYESLIDFSTGTKTELIPGTNIREVNISELFIELRKLIEDEAVTREQAYNGLQTNIDNEAHAREQADNGLQTNIDNEAQAREQADNRNSEEITTMRNQIDDLKIFVTPEMFGAVGNGEVDDTIAVQNAFNTNKVMLSPGKTYKITTPLEINNNLCLNGNCATIKAVGCSVINVRNVLNSLSIKYTNFVSNQNDAIYICCFWSSFDNCGFTGNLHLVNGDASSTLVENKITNCKFINGGIIVERGNKITDGIIDNCIFNNALKSISIGASAGWILSNCHIYGTGDTNAIELLECFNTFINNIYVEGGTIGLFATVQKKLKINNAELSGANKSIHIENASYHPDDNDIVLICNSSLNNNMVLLSKNSITNCTITNDELTYNTSPGHATVVYDALTPEARNIEIPLPQVFENFATNYIGIASASVWGQNNSGSVIFTITVKNKNGELSCYYNVPENTIGLEINVVSLTKNLLTISFKASATYYGGLKIIG